MTTKPMQVANEAFLLDRLAADAPRAQLYRELTQNAIEAIRRRMDAGDSRPGLIRWDADWLGVPNQKFKLCIIDNGDGMSANEMQRYLNNLAVQGANNQQSLTGNFGVGAKITALYNNTEGLIYLSWKDGVGHNVWLHRDDQAGIYGLKLLKDAAGELTYTRPMGNASKPSIIETTGTKVILLGNHPDEQTWKKPERLAGGDTNWLYKYLNTRYFRLPQGVTIQVRNLRKNTETWPSAEPSSGDQTLNFETIRGMKAILDAQVEHKASGDFSACGSVKLSEVTVHWWLFENRAAVDTAINPRAMPPGHAGLVFQDELYTSRMGGAARKVMALFGILYGADHIVLYVEPREAAGSVHADTGRSRVIINGADADSADLWSKWGEEFKAHMPSQITAFVERLLSADEDSTKEERRQRILERLARLRELLTPSRYRRTPDGALLAKRAASGGDTETSEGDLKARGGARGGSKGGRASDDYLASLADEVGEPANPVMPRRLPPDVQWISQARGQRGEGELEDRAADLPGDPLTAAVIRLNEDFRGFSDLFAYFVREFNAEGDEKLGVRIREVVKEWVETQVLEIVMAVRSLEGNSFWDPGQLEAALSPEALTTALMGRYFVIERVRRVLGSEISKPKSRSAA